MWFAWPCTMTTPIALLNFCSMIGNAPPFLSMFTRGEMVLPFSPAAASCVSTLMVFSKSLLILPNHPAHSGMTWPQKNLPCVVSNGHLVLLVPSPTMSDAKVLSSVLNCLLYSLLLSLPFGLLVLSLYCSGRTWMGKQ